MKLKDLVKKLAAKPRQDEEVEFLVYETKGGDIVSAEMHGPMTKDLMQVFAKHAREPLSPNQSITNTEK